MMVVVVGRVRRTGECEGMLHIVCVGLFESPSLFRNIDGGGEVGRVVHFITKQLKA